MTIRSYAQNFEDVLLWRALGSLGKGTYVDVGAGHPVHHSVTKLFSEAGWSGINIEPLPSLADALAADRPRDLNVQAAVSSIPGEVTLTSPLDWDELSTLSPRRAGELVAEGRRTLEITVPAVRLDSLFAEAGLEEIHFLKVDVEGAELETLGTLDLTEWRPWVIVVEVVSAGGDRDDHPRIEEHVTSAGYVKAYYDGLNDFYVAAERADELLPSFAVPVNVADDFVQVSGTDSVMIERVAEAVGLGAPAQPDEVLQRVAALRADRIRFEQRAADMQASRADDLSVISALRADWDRLDKMVRSLGEAVDAQDRALFARERLVAWYATELRNLRVTRSAQEKAAQEQLSASSREADEARRDADAARRQVGELLASTSWRMTLPLRFVRRPGHYLRSLRHR